MKRLVRFRAAVEPAEIRTATFRGAEHVVLPVVAMVGDSVVRPLGSEGPEFVPAEELARIPAGWNGRPVVPDHPENGAASANEPRTLEAEAFGLLFNTRYDGGRLKTEAWLDPDLAAAVGENAVSVIERARAGEPVEVSVGAWVTAEKRSGVHDGEKYGVVWRDIVPDHLAMLPEGTKGACSNDMGCGVRNAAELRAAEGGSMERWKRWLERLGLVVAAEDSGTSDNELREALWNALNAAVPGFDMIVEVFPESATVIYAVWLNEAVTTYRASYTFEGGEAMVDESSIEEVEAETKWKTKAAEAGDGDTPADALASDGNDPDEPVCTCNHRQAAATEGEGDSMNDKVKALVAALVNCENGPFQDDDAEALAALGEDRLTEIVAALGERNDEPPKPADDGSVRLSREEYADIKAASDSFKAAEAKRKAELVAAIGKASAEWSADELNEMSVVQLERLAKALKAAAPKVDYSGVGLPLDKGGKLPELPDTYGLRKEAN